MYRQTVAAALVALSCARLLAQEVTDLSLEEFMRIKVVSVNKSLKEMSKSPAAVFVITREDIRRAGATTIQDALRLAPGLTVMQVNGTEWTIGIRGSSGIFNNKVLVLRDGVTLYDPLFSGVLWVAQMTMLDDVERIEVIRGPGASVWGANAVAGVVNIITRKPSENQGGRVSAVAGTRDPFQARFGYGAKAGRNTFWRAWGQSSFFSQLQPATGESRLPAYTTNLGGLAVEFNPTDRDVVTLQAEGRRHAEQERQRSAMLGDSGTVLRNTGGETATLTARWEHVNRRGDPSALQVSQYGSHLNAGMTDYRLRTLAVDFHHTFQLPGHELMIGGGGRVDSIRTRATQDLAFDPSNSVEKMYNTFIQDDWTLIRDRLTAEVGFKMEHYSRAGVTADPTIRISFQPTRRQDLWVAWSRAVRTPSLSDYALRVPLAVGFPMVVLGMGSEDFQPETLWAVDCGYRIQARRNLYFDVAPFHHRYRNLFANLISLNGTVPQFTVWNGKLALPARAVNGGIKTNRGAEFYFHWEPGSKLQVSGSYSSLFNSEGRVSFYKQSILELDTDDAAKHQWQAHVSRDFHGWSTGMSFYDTRGLSSSPRNFNRLDAQLSRRIGESTEFSITGRNLLRPHLLETHNQYPYYAEFTRRSLEASFRWTF